MTVSDVPVVEGFVDFVEVGRGEFSRVFAAYQVAFDRRVALKVLNERLADDASVAAFERECQAMGGLSRHPFIVTVMASAFTSDYRPCIVMDLFERGNYMQLVRRDGPLPLEELLSLSVRVAGALATAHQDGVIHGDVKPQNIFKSSFGYPALGDFGIATMRNRLVERAGVGLSPHFVAPELIEMGAGAVGATADQYSLGATIYTLATGRRPFESDQPLAPQQVLAQALDAPAPTLPETFPRDLRAALRRAMAREPQDRFPDLGAFAVALANIEHRLGHRPTAIPIVGIDDDATITVDKDTLAALRQPTSTPTTEPASPPDGPDAPTIALGAPPPQQPPDTSSEPPEPPKPRRRRVLLGALALLLAAAATTTALLLTSGQDEPPPPPPPPPPPVELEPPPPPPPVEPPATEPPPTAQASPPPEPLLPDVPLPDVPLPDVPLPDVPLPDVPLPDVPLPEGPLTPVGKLPSLVVIEGESTRLDVSEVFSDSATGFAVRYESGRQNPIVDVLMPNPSGSIVVFEGLRPGTATVRLYAMRSRPDGISETIWRDATVHVIEPLLIVGESPTFSLSVGQSSLFDISRYFSPSATSFDVAYDSLSQEPIIEVIVEDLSDPVLTVLGLHPGTTTIKLHATQSVSAGNSVTISRVAKVEVLND